MEKKSEIKKLSKLLDQCDLELKHHPICDKRIKSSSTVKTELPIVFFKWKVNDFVPHTCAHTSLEN